ncbi:FAD-linked oxidase C-terminal domain-containing protein [Pseudovibrio sp. Tun.PSC04-5.I4]|uniref:FAD-binding oxidoreductase n=1 Tax=Pseudovibrio sp. Tun.PSC04-5.I4 TaxID=1798213 RepID=UPI0008903B3E|nr:FAD-linked oxidase C-terminal domain-containing protein [Pseudovibrio sp. Tun.PSC04-5.I4]SDR36015.1 D-lactate dehydrogenase (cytochrome) [Pseudovibrio sp. Tun.PSC04-5.I4]
MSLASMQLEVARNEEGIRAAVTSLSEQFGERCQTSLSLREQHAHTTSWLPNQPPDAVVFAHSTEEVAEIVKICAALRVPIIPFGTGSSLEGHLNAPGGGISLDLSLMNEIIAVHPEDLDCVVQPGVTRKQLNAYLRDTGLFFPIDPGADASIGGMAATRASGTNAVLYGTMKDVVLGLTVVMPDGTVVKTGGRAKKSSAGYDLTRLMIGSEGTLGVITEITLKLNGIPEAVSGGIASFDSIADCCNTVIEAVQYGIPVARIELLDALSVKSVNAYSKLTLPESPLLLVEFHGSDAGVREQAERFGEIAAENSLKNFEWTADPEERNRLWAARHDAYWAGCGLAPERTGLSTDVCVPISRLADCVTATHDDIAENGLLGPIVGHVGDGNFHVLVLTDINDPEAIAQTEAFVERLNYRAIEMGGTCTGEHGVGQGKMKYLPKEHGAGVAVMAAIKRSLDPLNIMNPGKIIAIDTE